MVWNPATYDEARKRLIPDFEAFYGTAAQLVARQGMSDLRVLDLGAGTGILSECIADSVPQVSLTLIDGSKEMLAVAKRRLADRDAVFVTSRLEDPLPDGQFDVIVSALSIHHLSDDDKRSLFERILAALPPGGLFVNAEQVAGPTAWHNQIYREMHQAQARSLGSDDEEWAAAVERMKIDQYASVQWHLTTWANLGFVRGDCFFKRHGFAVLAAWREAS